MFYYLSKIVWFFIQPSGLLLALALLGIALCFTRLARAGRWLALGALLALLTAGLSPLGNALLIPLEDRFAVPGADAPAPHGIIVLGGAFDTAASRARGSAELNEAAERMTKTVELARLYPDARILFTGGIGPLLSVGEREALAAERLLSGLGVAPERIAYEDRSRNTWQNAVFTRDMVQPGPSEVWWLVTSAYHMPRAVGCFRMAGFDVTPYPVDFRTRGPADYWRPFDSVSLGLRRVDIAMREWVGLVSYRLTGRTPALVPGV